MEPTKLLKACLVILLQLLNAVGFIAAVTGGAIGGALGLMYAASWLGIPDNFGIPTAGIGLGGLVGFFIWALPQLPKRSA